MWKCGNLGFRIEGFGDLGFLDAVHLGVGV